MDPHIHNTLIALLGLFGLKVVIGFGVDCFGYWSLGKIFNPRRNQFLLHQYLREFGTIPEPVRQTVAHILKDFSDCMDRDYESIYQRFQRQSRLEIDAYSIVPLKGDDETLQRSIEIVNRLLTRAFRLPKSDFGFVQVERFVLFSINEFKRQGIRTQPYFTMLETEEHIQILQARCAGVEDVSSVRVKICLIDMKN